MALQSRLADSPAALFPCRSFARFPSVSASTWGQGRVVAYGHERYIGDAQMDSPLGKLVRNSIVWGAKGKTAGIRVATTDSAFNTGILARLVSNVRGWVQAVLALCQQQHAPAVPAHRLTPRHALPICRTRRCSPVSAWWRLHPSAPPASTCC